MIRNLGGIAAVLALTSAPAFAQSTGTLTGTVTDAVTSAPLAGGGASDLIVTLLHGNGQPLAVQVTNAAGEYAFTGLAPGPYYVKVTTSTTGYISEIYNDVPCVAADCTALAGTPLAVAAGATVAANFALSGGGGFSGIVRRASLSMVPVPGASVAVYNAATSFVGTVTAGADGAYAVTGLPAGTYFAKVLAGRPGVMGRVFGGEDCHGIPSPSDDLCRLTSGTPIVVTAGANTPDIDFALTPAGLITGQIVEAGTGQPLTNLNVELLLGERRVAFANTGSTNLYLFANVPPGVYRVRTVNSLEFVDGWYGGHCVGCPGTPSVVAVAPGAAVAGIDIALGRGRRITGALTCTVSGPTLLPAIEVYSTLGTLVKRVDQSFGCMAGQLPTPYTISGLRDGSTYYLVARDPAFVPFGTRLSGGILIDQLYAGTPCVASDCDPLSGVPVPVPPGGDVTGIDFHFVQGASSNIVPGLPPAVPPIRVFDARGVELTNVVRAIFFGGQQVVGLPPGTYFASQGDRLHARGYCANCPPTAGKPIVIEPGQLQFTLDFGDPTTTTISGTVRDEAGGAPLSTITVQLLTASGLVVGSAASALNGAYSLPTLGPGTYYLRTVNQRGYVDEVYPDVICPMCDLRSGTPVVAGAANVSGIDFSLAAGGLVTGRVVNGPTGMPIENVPISLLTASGTIRARAATALDGRYSVSVPPGTYRARSEPTATNDAQIFDGLPCSGVSCDVAAGTPVVVNPGVETGGIDFESTCAAPGRILPARLARAVIGTPYRQVLTPADGFIGNVFTVSSGVLPAGLSLSPAGVLSGTPVSSGRHEFVVGRVDGPGCSSGRSYTLDVHACAFTLTPASASVPAAGGTVTVAIGDSCGSTDVDVGGTFVAIQSSTSDQVVFAVPANPLGTARSASVTIGRRVFVINQGGLAVQPPFGSFDGPADGAQVSGSVGIGGWALDDLGVMRVRIVRDPVGGEGANQIYLGDAVFVPGARPDVRAAYPAVPNSDRAGWGFLILTNMLPNQGNGAFRVYAYAEDVEGLQTLLGARTLVAVNSTSAAPFGAIDTPAQGATISGTGYINFGWALTPQPKVIPFDGSTMHVLIDGLPVGSPTYNQFRPDVATLFPGLANSNGAVGYRVIDTTALAEGLHTIAWYVSDSQNAAAGIGSRYFSVENSADAQPVLAAGAEAGRREESVMSMPIAATPAAAAGTGTSAGGDGPVQIRLRALERLELPLVSRDGVADGRDAGVACSATWAGYTIADKSLAALPVGASLDPSGTFYWQPGPGFGGVFELLFVRTGCDGRKERLSVRVTIEK